MPEAFHGRPQKDSVKKWGFLMETAKGRLKEFAQEENILRRSKDHPRSEDFPYDTWLQRQCRNRTRGTPARKTVWPGKNVKGSTPSQHRWAWQWSEYFTLAVLHSLLNASIRCLDRNTTPSPVPAAKICLCSCWATFNFSSAAMYSRSNALFTSHFLVGIALSRRDF